MDKAAKDKRVADLIAALPKEADSKKHRDTIAGIVDCLDTAGVLDDHVVVITFTGSGEASVGTVKV